MTETRKKIIELIESYMDKALSEWCYVKIQKVSKYWYKESEWNYRQISISTLKISSLIYSWIGNENILWLRDNEQLKIEVKPILWLSSDKIKIWLENNKITTNSTIPKDRQNWNIIDYKIIWHYDITAVLKYIDNKVWLWSYINWISYMEHLARNIKIFEKPIHLYTEEEDKALLELLQKLWN